ncbi:MAG: nucleoside hydrolase-like domain-containing protein [Ferruginibacter sp.]
MHQQLIKRIAFIFTILLFLGNIGFSQTPKNRVIMLTDIENEPDDTETLIRLLLYANQIDIKGLIATTSVHLKTKVYPQSINRILQVYGKVQANLNKNEAGYPTAENLLKLVKSGRPEYGMKAVGDGNDSEGSAWIIKILEENDNRPLWICAWGGPNTLAQALFKLKKTKTTGEFNRLLQKLRVYTISDQDDSGIWMRNNFPELFYVVTPGGYGKATWTGIHIFVPGINNETISNTWLANNIQQNHGPLGALYPDVSYGMEGDTPSWLSLIPNGLSDPEHPEWGGWGGRYELYQPKLSDIDVKGFTGGVPVDPETRAIWTNAEDKYSPILYNPFGRAIKSDTAIFTGNKVSVWRWRDDFQNDFAARMDWTIKTYKDANHPPVPALNHPNKITVKSGEYFYLDASGSIDPDGDHLSYWWFQYPEAGTYKQTVKFMLAENLYRTSLIAPVVEKPETIHFILKVTDKGTPPLSRYKRVIVQVVPK